MKIQIDNIRPIRIKTGWHLENELFVGVDIDYTILIRPQHQFTGSVTIKQGDLTLDQYKELIEQELKKLFNGKGDR